MQSCRDMKRFYKRALLGVVHTCGITHKGSYFIRNNGHLFPKPLHRDAVTKVYACIYGLWHKSYLLYCLVSFVKCEAGREGY